ncbi:MAG: alanine--tRNA ligase [Campylobacterales bacterium]|nr:alanine--tRNA ligase [Campylobacterales bacterium]
MDIRKSFLEFFSTKGHEVVESSALVPDDATLLFTNAGMVQFKDIFTAQAPIPANPRATSSQTCIRAVGKHNDLDTVGYTARHHTMFEMLGNFSFGDYFKEDAIAYAWEFVTSKEHLHLPIEKIWVTVHNDDNESFELWSNHIAPSRIMPFGDKDNFWQMGDTGPCGPCSEIFYDQGEEHFNSSEDVMGGDGDRFLEIWNLVFMQYERSSDGTLTPLPKPSIDTGMGLERVVAIKEGQINNFHSSLFMPIIRKMESIVGKEYNGNASFRVIADHLRSVSFLLAQGVNFDKEGRGYVLRRIMRRAIRHGYLLGLREPFMYKLVDTLGDIMGKSYPYLLEKAQMIKSAMSSEEERFLSTIESGIKLFNEELENTSDKFSGEVAFKLYDTYGFPLDLTQDMLREKNITLDEAAFDENMEAQKAKSRASWSGSGDAAAMGEFKQLKEQFGVNNFVGYSSTTATTKVLALLDSDFKMVDSLDGNGWVMLENTPFYAESGGQCGDSGELKVNSNSIVVENTQKFHDINLSKIVGKLYQGDEVEAIVDTKRADIARNHSATHLLHAGLKAILGDHVAQAGSLNDDKKLRFDFSHSKAMSQAEIEQVEAWVNERILGKLETNTKLMSIDDAKSSGAVALFGEKYGDEVRVVSFGSDSVELCGGTHVANTSDIGMFLITKESGVSAGVRRVEAICGREAYKVAKAMREEINTIKTELKSQDALNAISKLKEQIKSLKNDLINALNSSKKDLEVVEINGITTIVAEVENGDIKALIDEAKNKYPKIAIMLLMKKGDKVMIACGSKESPIKAGDWIKNIAPIVGGGGGGRPDFAQAGGKDTSKIDEALGASKAYLQTHLV